MDASSAKRTLHYAWIVAALTFLTLLIGAAVRATPSVLIVPLERDFHLVARYHLVRHFSQSCALWSDWPFAAELMNRFGVRRIIAGSLLLVSTAVALTTRMSASWQLVMLWESWSAAARHDRLVLGATVVNRWFTTQRGVVMGVLTASTATGQLLFLPVLAALVERHGWRSAALLIAGCAAAVIPFAVFFIRERPADLDVLPYGEQSFPSSAFSVAHVRESALAVLRSVAPSRDFWLLFASFFICGASTNGLIGTHLIPACMDHGIPEVKAAGLLAVMGIFDLIGTTSSGWLSDRFDNRHLLAWYYGLRGLSLIYLPFSFDINF
jgi:MFS family permease